MPPNQVVDKQNNPDFFSKAKNDNLIFLERFFNSLNQKQLGKCRAAHLGCRKKREFENYISNLRFE